MSNKPAELTISTPRLELATVTARFIEALVAGDVWAAGNEIGARVARWLASDPSHLIQLHLAEKAAAAAGLTGIGRVVVVGTASGNRRAIGSIGFGGPPDERGRLEVSCRIHPAHRGHGYAGEALTALLDWATARFGVTRFLIAVPSPREPGDLVSIEVGSDRAEPDDRVDELAGLLETVTRRSRLRSGA